jgi:transposase-like protein
MAKFTQQMTVGQFDELFPTDEACKAYLTARRWPEGVRCPRCGNEKLSHLKARPFHWQCRNCSGTGYRFSVLVGTPFENTNIGLRKWFQVIYMMLTGKKGIAALEVQRVLGFGSYETAHYMCHRIRAALVDPEFRKLMGIVEVDETYEGGKNKNRHADKKMIGGGVTNKFPVMGATDESAVYLGQNKKGFKHESVRHSAGEYVRGVVHTQTIDGFWSLLKRGIMGTFHNVSKKYLPLYVAEFEFRYNNRHNPDIFGAAVTRC